MVKASLHSRYLIRLLTNVAGTARRIQFTISLKNLRTLPSTIDLTKRPSNWATYIERKVLGTRAVVCSALSLLKRCGEYFDFEL